MCVTIQGLRQANQLHCLALAGLTRARIQDRCAGPHTFAHQSENIWLVYNDTPANTKEWAHAEYAGDLLHIIRVAFAQSQQPRSQTCTLMCQQQQQHRHMLWVIVRAHVTVIPISLAYAWQASTYLA